jgi:flavin-dependent dehydrogenase
VGQAWEASKGSVTILGAGPSGLSAAISLAREGHAVDVFERRRRVGERFNGDLQGMENWSGRIDVRKRLHEMGIQTNFDFTPFDRLTITNLTEQVEFDLTRPAFYLVRRGPFPGTLDYGLAAQARELGVRIHLGKVKPETEGDIVATGSIPGRVFGVVRGVAFQTNQDDTAMAILGDTVGHRGYAYLLITNGRGSLCSTVMGRSHKAEACFQSAREAFSRLVSLDMVNPRKFTGVGSFSAAHCFERDGRLYVGEAAGIQDLFWGFGMNLAIASGYLAARSISRGENYEKAVTTMLGGRLRASMVNRLIWEAIHLDAF